MFTVVIPARFGSTRLPGKPLLDIGGIPMIQHVWQRAMESGARKTIIATDDARVAATCSDFGAQVEMTDSSHASGTERIAEVAARLSIPENTVIVNVQGDEPFIPSLLIAQVAENLQARSGKAEAATLCERIIRQEDIFDPDIVKVVVDHRGLALYFSRAPIPWDREAFRQPCPKLDRTTEYFRHIGIYAYRAGYLRTYHSLPPSPLENLERLEQLRILYHGGRIHVAEALERPGPGIDSAADLERVRRMA